MLGSVGMKTRAFVCLVGLACANTSVCAGTANPSPSPGFEIGKPFPDLILPSLADGRPASLSQFRGQKVLLHIFASW